MWKKSTVNNLKLADLKVNLDQFPEIKHKEYIAELLPLSMHLLSFMASFEKITKTLPKKDVFTTKEIANIIKFSSDFSPLNLLSSKEVVRNVLTTDAFTKIIPIDLDKNNTYESIIFFARNKNDQEKQLQYSFSVFNGTKTSQQFDVRLPLALMFPIFSKSVKNKMTDKWEYTEFLKSLKVSDLEKDKSNNFLFTYRMREKLAVPNKNFVQSSQDLAQNGFDQKQIKSILEKQGIKQFDYKPQYVKTKKLDIPVGAPAGNFGEMYTRFSIDFKAPRVFKRYGDLSSVNFKCQLENVDMNNKETWLGAPISKKLTYDAVVNISTTNVFEK